MFNTYVAATQHFDLDMGFAIDMVEVLDQTFGAPTASELPMKPEQEDMFNFICGDGQ